MHIILGSFLVPPKEEGLKKLKYQIISNIEEYKSGNQVVVVSYLNPDLYLLFGSVDLIITESGSVLSHISIVGREYGIPIFLAPRIIDDIDKTGIVIAKKDKLCFF